MFVQVCARHFIRQVGNIHGSRDRVVGVPFVYKRFKQDDAGPMFLLMQVYLPSQCMEAPGIQL